ncbi:MAG: exonuclease domain-containing protein [Oscillospiraceae bacterium]|jgi:inhibitor of KinA sporulation pathway (predicted exonuclease)|nr:exonuclease domain-containing protein [Oscillospiraceae bacterium]
MNYILFDLEATCWDSKEMSVQPHEIIEIGAAKVDDNADIIDTFQTFIKPTKNPVLSEFCINLTKIRQFDVDYAPYFSEALFSFEDWINKTDTKYMMLSWGYFDRKLIEKECTDRNYTGNIVEMLKTHRSIKHDFMNMRGVKRCGMERAMEFLGIPLEGTHHRAIDDAMNIAKIFSFILRDWKVWFKNKNKEMRRGEN